MVQGSNGPGFPLKARTERGVGEFDGDVAIQPGIASPIHLSHTTRAKERKDFIGTEFVSDRKRHRADKGQCSLSPTARIDPGYRLVASAKAQVSCRRGPEKLGLSMYPAF